MCRIPKKAFIHCKRESAGFMGCIPAGQSSMPLRNLHTRLCLAVGSWEWVDNCSHEEWMSRLLCITVWDLEALWVLYYASFYDICRFTVFIHFGLMFLLGLAVVTKSAVGSAGTNPSTTLYSRIRRRLCRLSSSVSSSNCRFMVVIDPGPQLL
jgi:hypothetical protein